VSSRDYLGQVRSDPDFAAREVTSHQSRADKAVAERDALKERLDSLGRYASDDPAVITRALDDYVSIMNNKDMAQAIERVRSGNHTPTGETEDDEYLTDEQRETRELRSQLMEAQQRLSGVELSSAERTLTEHIEKVQRDYYLTPDAFESAKKKLNQDIDRYKRAGKSGEAAIRNLMGPNSFDIVRSLMLAGLTPDALLDCQKNRDRRKGTALGGLATDGRPGTVSTGREPPPDFSKSANAAVEAALWAEANPDGHDSV
jgi:hypothetical protein